MPYTSVVTGDRVDVVWWDGAAGSLGEAQKTGRTRYIQLRGPVCPDGCVAELNRLEQQLNTMLKWR